MVDIVPFDLDKFRGSSNRSDTRTKTRKYSRYVARKSGILRLWSPRWRSCRFVSPWLGNVGNVNGHVCSKYFVFVEISLILLGHGLFARQFLVLLISLSLWMIYFNDYFILIIIINVSIYLNDKNMISRKKNKSTLLIQGRNDRTLLLTRDELRFEPEKLNWRESSAKYISSQAYDISLRIKKMRMFTTIRDESDRLLKSATVLLISFDFVPLRSFCYIRRVQVLRVISWSA